LIWTWVAAGSCHGSDAVAGNVAVAVRPPIVSQPPEGAEPSSGAGELGRSPSRRCGSTTMLFGRITWATVPPSMLARSSTRMPYREASRLTTARPISRNAATSTVGGSESRRLSESICSSDNPRPRSSTWITT
jgi:hypothetical protein